MICSNDQAVATPTPPRRQPHLPARLAKRIRTRLSTSVSLMFAALLTAMLTPAHAALISMDSLYGTNSITRDTATGLEWLDPFLGASHGAGGTQFWTYDQVRNEFGTGGLFEGFRFANRNDLDTLFHTSAGIDPAGGSHTAIGDLIGMLGDTFSAGFGWANFFAATAYFDDGHAIDAGLASLTVYQNASGFFNGTAAIFDSAYSALSNPNPYGMWLVRDYLQVTPAVDVAEPPILALLGIAFALVVLRRRFS